MKYLHIILTITILNLFTLNFSISAFAEPRLPDLKRGMSYVEVVKLWGSPNDKIEKEIKRRDVWIYNSSKVLFEKGSVVAVINSEGIDTLNAEAVALQQNKKVDNNKKLRTSPNSPPNQDTVDDILTEIMKDPSNSEGGADNRAMNPSLPPQIMQPPNMINQVPPPEPIN